MALFKRRCNFTDVNCGRDMEYQLGPIGGLLIAEIIIFLLSGGIGLMVHSCHDDKVERLDCLAALEKNRNASCGAKHPQLVSLKLILRGSNQEAADEANRLFQPLASSNKNPMMQRWMLEKIYAAIKSDMKRLQAIELLCSSFGNILRNNQTFPAYKICDKDTYDEVVKFYKNGYVAPTKVYLGFYATAIGTYLLCGLVFMISFLVHFGQPSGRVIAWMAVFAPIFIPLWAVVGTGCASLLALRSVKRGWTARSAARAAKKQSMTEARLIGKEVMSDREEIARLMQEVEANSTVPADIKQALKNRLQAIRAKNEQEAKLRVELEDLAHVRQRAEKLSAKVDDVEVRVSARENVRNTFSDEEK